MVLSDDDFDRLGVYLLVNGYFRQQKSVSQEGDFTDETNKDEQNVIQDDSTWFKAVNAKFLINGLHLKDKLDQIGQFEVDLSAGKDAEFIHNISSEGSNMEPIWGDGCVTDPGETLLPESSRFKCLGHSFNYFDSLNGNVNSQSFVIVENRYGIFCDGSENLPVYCLNKYISDGEHMKPLKVMTVDELFVSTKHSGNPHSPREPNNLFKLVKKLDSFMGIRAVAFASSSGDIVLYDTGLFSKMLQNKIVSPILCIKAPFAIENITSCDDASSSISILLLNSRSSINVLVFVESFKDPTELEISFPKAVNNLEFLNPTADGFTAICQLSCGTIFSLFFPKHDLLQGRISYEILDLVSTDNHLEQSPITFCVVSKDNFATVSQYPFLSLNYNLAIERNTLEHIYQDSIILESLPLYPIESNHLGIGADIAQIEVPIPNYELLYENFNSLPSDPIRLRFTTYNKNGNSYSRVFVNNRFTKTFNGNPTTSYISKRSHGLGNTKVYKAESSNHLTTVEKSKLGWNFVPESDLGTLWSTKDKVSLLKDRIEDIRLEKKGYYPFHPASYPFKPGHMENLRDLFSPATYSLRCFSTIFESLTPRNHDFVQNSSHNIPGPKHVSTENFTSNSSVFVNQVIRKYSQLIPSSRFDVDGPKYNSKSSQNQLIFNVNSNLGTCLRGANPLMINALTDDPFPVEINCVDLCSEKNIVCHIKELSYVATATSFGIVFLYRLTTWRGIYAYRFEKLLNVTRIQDVCDDSDEESKSEFCETFQRLSTESES